MGLKYDANGLTGNCLTLGIANLVATLHVKVINGRLQDKMMPFERGKRARHESGDTRVIFTRPTIR